MLKTLFVRVSPLAGHGEEAVLVSVCLIVVYVRIQYVQIGNVSWRWDYWRLPVSLRPAIGAP